MKLLVVYGTDRGQTAKISRFIAHHLREDGFEVDVIDGRRLPSGFTVRDYHGIVVGASVRGGRFQSYIVDFVEQYRDDIQRKPSAFFSVSMTQADPKTHERAMNPIRRFLNRTAWQPDAIASFAGSMAYLHSRLVMRLVWRRIPLPDVRTDERSRHPTGTAGSIYEYTDWDAVARFAGEFAHHVRSGGRVSAPV